MLDYTAEFTFSMRPSDTHASHQNGSRYIQLLCMHLKSHHAWTNSYHTNKRKSLNVRLLGQLTVTC